MGATTNAGRSSTNGVFGRVLASLPDRVLVVFLAAVLSVSIAVTIQQFTPWLVLPLFVVALVALWRFIPTRAVVGRRDGWGAAIAVLAAIVWIAVNIPFASELLEATRDPSLYTVLGLWLTHHASPGIDVSEAAHAIQGIPGFTVNLGAFAASADNAVHLQGGATLPALLGVGGWLFGVHGVLAANVVLGGVGLIATYALARVFVGPFLALVVECALGLSVAMMFLSRAPYSETIMLATCAAGIVWLIAAFRENRISLWIVAGLFLGAAGFARIDGPISIAGPAAALLVAVFLLKDEGRFGSIARGAKWFAVAAIGTQLLGLLGLYVNENSYLHDLKSQVVLLWSVMLTMVVATLVAIELRKRWSRFPAIPDRAVKPFGIVAVILFGGLYLFWLSRPLWYVARHSTGAVAIAIGAMQAREGLPVDPTRSYDEMTLSWVGWYFGWPTVILAGIGLGLMIYLGIRRRRIGLLVLAGATLSVAALYFTRVSITPDQAWAYRRLLPVITPGLLIAAVYPIQAAVQAWGGRVWVRVGALAAAVLVALVPLVTWNGLLRAIDGGNGYAFASSLCDNLSSDTVLLVSKGSVPYYAATLRTVCGVNVISTTPATSTEDLIALKKQVPDLDVVMFSPDSMPSASALPAATGSAEIVRWETTLSRLPNQLIGNPRHFWVGTLDDSGAFQPKP